MTTLIAVFVAVIFWVGAWGLGMKGFDAMLVALLIVLAAATFQRGSRKRIAEPETDAT